MPKTYTDDVAPVLPSAIAGPFQVANATDHDSYLKVDPALGRITAAGDARPLRRQYFGYARNTGVSSSVVLAVGMACRQVNPGYDAGFYTNSIGIANEMDLAEPSSIFVLLAAAASSVLSNVAVRIEVTATYAKDGQWSPHITVVTYDHVVPDSWQAEAVEVVRIDDGNGRTFAPSRFEAGDVLGLRVRLARAAAEDTFDQGVKLAIGVIFEYTAKQL